MSVWVYVVIEGVDVVSTRLLFLSSVLFWVFPFHRLRALGSPGGAFFTAPSSFTHHRGSVSFVSPFPSNPLGVLTGSGAIHLLGCDFSLLLEVFSKGWHLH